MIDWKIFKSIYFWGILSFISIIVGGISFLKNNERQEMLAQAPLKYCKEYRTNAKVSSILVITKQEYKENYILYFTGKDKNQNFRSYRIPEECKVKILSHEYDGKLIKAVLVGATVEQGAYSEFWIWHEFLYDSPAN